MDTEIIAAYEYKMRDPKKAKSASKKLEHYHADLMYRRSQAHEREEPHVKTEMTLLKS